MGRLDTISTPRITRLEPTGMVARIRDSTQNRFSKANRNTWSNLRSVLCNLGCSLFTSPSASQNPATTSAEKSTVEKTMNLVVPYFMREHDHPAYPTIAPCQIQEAFLMDRFVHPHRRVCD